MRGFQHDNEFLCVLFAAALRAMNEAALCVFEKGHTPIIGVNMALPVIACAVKSGLKS